MFISVLFSRLQNSKILYRLRKFGFNMLLRNKKNVLESVVYIYILLYNKEFVERNSLFIFTDLLRLFCLHWTSFKVFGHFPEFCLWREHAQKAARVAWHIHRWFVLIRKLRGKKKQGMKSTRMKERYTEYSRFHCDGKIPKLTSPTWGRRWECWNSHAQFNSPQS